MWPQNNNSDRCFFIAEIGVNHNGDVGIAKKMIDVAAEAGADAVKFQTFFADQLATQHAKKAAYQERNTGMSDSQYAMLKRLELSRDDFFHLKQYCDLKNIEFLSTPFSIEAADLLQEIGVNGFKVSSGDLTYVQLLSHLATFSKPVILSSGMATVDELDVAVEALGRGDVMPVAILHCVSNYPAAVEDCNLRAIETIRKRYGLPTGWSDHSEGDTIAIAAVAMGAEIIEKHFTLDRDMPGPDHRASLEPEELTQLIRSIRTVGDALGNGVKSPTSAELETAEVARRSIVAAVNIASGDPITLDALAFLRPGNGLPPIMASRIVGKIARNDISAGDQITGDDVDGFDGH